MTSKLTRAGAIQAPTTAGRKNPAAENVRTIASI